MVLATESPVANELPLPFIPPSLPLSLPPFVCPLNIQTSLYDLCASVCRFVDMFANATRVTILHLTSTAHVASAAAAAAAAVMLYGVGNWCPELGERRRTTDRDLPG